MNRLPKFTPLSFSGSARETPYGFEVSIGFESVSVAVEGELVFVGVVVFLLVLDCSVVEERGEGLSSVAVMRSRAKATRRKSAITRAKVLFVAGDRSLDFAASRLVVDEALDE